MNQEILENVGLTKGEAGVYLALLQLGSSRVGKIVHLSGVAYSNIYTILERLIEKGLVSFVIKAKTKYFQAVEPEQLLEYIRKKEKELQEQKEQLEHTLPQLQLLQKLSREHQEAEVFVGWKGVKTAFEKILGYYTPNEHYRFIYTYPPQMGERIDLFFNQFHNLYTKRKVNFLGISREEYRKSWFVKKAGGYTKMRYVSFPLPANVEIVKDIVLIVSWTEKPVAFFLRSSEIAKEYSLYFDTAWKQAKP